jgi:hypothetical protein
VNSRHFGSVTSTFDPKHLTECPRRIIYRTTLNNVGQTYGDNYIENEFKFRVSRIIRQSGIKVLSDNLSLSDCNYNIVGNLDYVIQLECGSTATKFYSVDDETFQNVLKKGAIRKDVVEVMVYMWLVELNSGLMVYENKNNNQITSFHIKPYKPIIKSVINKCKILLEHEFKGTKPDRPYNKRTSNECKQCEFVTECWKNQGEEDNA